MSDCWPKSGMDFDLARLKDELYEGQQEMAMPEFWQDADRAQRISTKTKACEDKITRYESFVSRRSDLAELCNMAEAEDDDSLLDEMAADLTRLMAELDAMRLETLLVGPYDACDAIIALHAGAGGTEAQDWAQMLHRMYVRWGERRGFTVRVLDVLEGDEAGIKSSSIEISGPNAYGYLKCERGVHRLVRISPFDASARRHTSFASLDVMPVIEDDGDVAIRTEDLRIDTYRAGGAGGQHVNRTDSAVRITHLPTGIVVQCQNERSQIQNRETAMRMLRAKLGELHEQELMDQMRGIKGEQKKIEWGNQIRSYVFQPYTMVKDHRTNHEAGAVDAVMDGELDGFITAYLQMMCAPDAE